MLCTDTNTVINELIDLILYVTGFYIVVAVYSKVRGIYANFELACRATSNVETQGMPCTYASSI